MTKTKDTLTITQKYVHTHTAVWMPMEPNHFQRKTVSWTSALFCCFLSVFAWRVVCCTFNSRIISWASLNVGSSGVNPIPSRLQHTTWQETIVTYWKLGGQGELVQEIRCSVIHCRKWSDLQHQCRSILHLACNNHQNIPLQVTNIWCPDTKSAPKSRKPKSRDNLGNFFVSWVTNIPHWGSKSCRSVSTLTTLARQPLRQVCQFSHQL